MKFVVGLTGGIGSGKSTVAKIFEGLGAAIVDTDEIAHALTGPGGKAMAALREAFGPGFVAADGGLDRAALRRAVFSDASMRARLEAIVHPLVGSEAGHALEAARGAYALLVVPLLFESRGLLRRVARTLVVDCPLSLQLERVARRPGLSDAEARAIAGSQWPRWRRLQLADDVIWNGGEAGALEAPCRRLHEAYCTLAARP